MNKSEIKIFVADDWHAYELLDTGDGEKLERFGQYSFVRPCEDAVWEKSLPSDSISNLRTFPKQIPSLHAILILYSSINSGAPHSLQIFLARHALEA